jgi:hypothetical protein
MPLELETNFGAADQRIVAEEIQAGPFGEKLVAMLATPEGAHQASLGARKAVANEMDSSLYPESRGEWPALRKIVVDLAKSMPGILEKELERLPIETLTALLQQVAAGRSFIGVPVSGLGQFDIGGIISSVIDAGSKIYTTKLATVTQTKIANIQASANIATLDAQIKIANAQQAIAEAQAVQATESSSAAILTKDIGGGIPFWVIPATIVALGIGITLFFTLRR